MGTLNNNLGMNLTDENPLINNPFNSGASQTNLAPIPPPSGNNFLLLDGTPMLLLDGTNLLLL